jgi:hypothetical protein
MSGCVKPHGIIRMDVIREKPCAVNSVERTTTITWLGLYPVIAQSLSPVEYLITRRQTQFVDLFGVLVA